MIDNIVSIAAMCEVATESLTGRAVKINLDAPIYVGCVGHVRLENGEVVINIDPNVSLMNFYLTWLHEVGHLLYGHLNNAENWLLPPEVEKMYLEKGALIEMTTEELEEYKQSPKEAEANSFAYAMDHYAQQAAKDTFFNDDIPTRIRILANTIIKQENTK